MAKLVTISVRLQAADYNRIVRACEHLRPPTTPTALMRYLLKVWLLETEYPKGGSK